MPEVKENPDWKVKPKGEWVNEYIPEAHEGWEPSEPKPLLEAICGQHWPRVKEEFLKDHGDKYEVIEVVEGKVIATSNKGEKDITAECDPKRDISKDGTKLLTQCETVDEGYVDVEHPFVSRMKCRNRGGWHVCGIVREISSKELTQIVCYFGPHDGFIETNWQSDREWTWQ